MRLLRHKKDGKNPKRFRLGPSIAGGIRSCPQFPQARDRADRQLQAHCEELRQQLKEVSSKLPENGIVLFCQILPVVSYSAPVHRRLMNGWRSA